MTGALSLDKKREVNPNWQFHMTAFFWSPFTKKGNDDTVTCHCNILAKAELPTLA